MTLRPTVTRPVRLITFDLDDTLWDVRPALEAAERAQWQALATRYPNLSLAQTPPSELTALRQAVLSDRPELAHHISEFREVFIDQLLQHHGVPLGESALGAREAFKAFLSERHKVTVYEGALSVLTALGEHYQLGALTNGNADVYKTPIGPCFDHAWRAEEFGISKPDPALFNRAFAQAGVEASEVIHVGDCHDNDVSGAVSAGATAIWFNPAGGNSSVAARVVEKLADLPGVIGELTGRNQQP